MPASRAEPIPSAGGAGATARRLVVLGAVLLGLSLLYNLPVELAHFRWPILAALSLEVTVVLAALALIRPLRSGAVGAVVAGAVAVATTLVVLLKIAELLLRESLARPLNPLVDAKLLPSLGHLLTETLGGLLGWLALAGLAAIPLLVLALTLIAVRAAQRALDDPLARAATVTICGVLIGLFALGELAPSSLGNRRPVSDHASATVAAQWRLGREVLAEMATFEQAIATDRFQDLPPDRLLAGLDDTDVLLMFIESYGRSALEQPRYGATILPTLDAFEQGLAEHGLVAASAYLSSPTVGGQSWLAHGTLESGLWLAHQAHYDLLAESERLTLTRAFAKAGHRTIALKPAITRLWPEGERLGFARIYAAADLGYAGKPYNWVTMPDQYTLSVLEREERQGQSRLFVEASLISSHAPWTPIPPVLDDWASIGDGRVFSRWADAGDPPEVVWRDPERVRHQYTLAIDYVLRVLASYAGRYVDERTLLILSGDHQPAPLITGEGAGRDVPIHVITGDPTLLEPFLAWGFTPGMRPDPDAQVRPMDAFRDFFLETFSAPSEGGDQASFPRTLVR